MAIREGEVAMREEQQELQPGAVVRMKKPHPCGSNSWELIRIGMDVKIKCLKCSRIVSFKRKKFEKALREILHREGE